ncbi:MAG: S41 family peptidase [Pyrinomonadaceae bacterium]
MKKTELSIDDIRLLARRRRNLSAVLVLIVCLLLSSGVNRIKAQEGDVGPAKEADRINSTENLTGKDRQELFEKVWKTINDKYYDPSFNGVDWAAVRERYRPRAGAVTSDQEFYLLLSQMAAELHDAHTRFRSPYAYQLSRNHQAVSIGLSLFEVEGQAAVSSVHPDSEAAQAGVEPGMLVRAIDGVPVAKLLAQAREQVGVSSSERATKVLTYRQIIAGEDGTALKLELARADGTSFEVLLKRRLVPDVSQSTSRLLADGYGYIKFNHFNSPVDKQLADALEKFKNAPGLILDLRGNSGGDVQLVLRIAGYFLPDKVLFRRAYNRLGQTKQDYAGRPGQQLYAGPLIILVNESSGSGAELFSSALQESGRAAVVGSQSCGCALGVTDHRVLKGGGELTVSEVGYMTAGGRKVEGAGVIPDRPVSVKLADLRERHDAALDEALNLLHSLKMRAGSKASQSSSN